MGLFSLWGTWDLTEMRLRTKRATYPLSFVSSSFLMEAGVPISSFSLFIFFLWLCIKMTVVSGLIRREVF